MKKLIKTCVRVYVYVSIFLMFIYLPFLEAMEIVPPDELRTTIFFLLPIILIFHAVLVVPLVIVKQLGQRERLMIVKVLRYISFGLCFILTAYITGADDEGWVLIFINLVYTIFLVVGGLIALMNTGERKVRREQVTAEYLFFYISLIMWSSFLLMAAISFAMR